MKNTFGLIGLGTMGRNFLLNMADSNFAVAGYDLSQEQVDTLSQAAGDLDVFATTSLSDFIRSLETPRAVMLLVPAGKIVDQVVDQILPHLSKGDIIIDGGNSFFKDTARRQADLLQKGIHFIGLGVSGGAEGARLGPSMMPGGSKEAYARIQPMLEATAAKKNGEPCVTYLGKGSVGHYVKMVHNGIEYGLMQLLAEAYGIMKEGLHMSNDEIQKTFDTWNKGRLESFLVEITAAIFKQKDDLESGDLIDAILDFSRSKGTGKWTSQNALDLGVPVPTIDLSVVARYLSGYKPEREVAAEVLFGPTPMIQGENGYFLEQLEAAMYFSFIACYAQGFDLLQKASKEYDFDLDLAAVARIWRAGCIIRAELLEDFYAAFQQKSDLTNLLIDPKLAKDMQSEQQHTRAVIRAAVLAGIPIPALHSCLMYFDSYRTARLSANLIQAQRDYFGSHTYERVDREGKFHTEWTD